MRRALLVIGACLCAMGLLTTLLRVGELSREERSYHGAQMRLGDLPEPTAVLGGLTLMRGQRVTFSACSSDAFQAQGWASARFAIFHERPRELVLRVALDEPRRASLRQGPEGGCVVLARADALGGEGTFSIAIEVPPSESAPHTVSALAPAGTQLWTHVTALRDLTSQDVFAPLLAFLGVLLMTLAWLLPRPAPSAFERLAAAELLSTVPLDPGAALPALLEPASLTAQPSEHVSSHPPRAQRAPSRVLGLALLGLAVTFTLSAALPPSPFTPLGAALTLFSAQLLLAFALGRVAGLKLVAPARWPWLLVVMPPLGAALRLGLAPLAQLVPPTGVAPIEHLVSAPSGLLTMLTMGLVAPFAEELFFRGLLFAPIEALRGRGWATSLTALLFALLHAPQAYGAWPSLVSIACAGLAFSAVRALTGSTLASLLVHVGYNGVIALPYVAALLAR